VLKVYLETSFFSECCTIRTGEIARGRRAVSLNWWENQARNFEFYVSGEVVRELSSPDFPAAVRNPASMMLAGLGILPPNTEVAEFAKYLVAERVMPGPELSGDAIHMAMAVVHELDFLLTWNQKHLANPRKRTHLLIVCARAGLRMPTIVTPDLMNLEG